MEQSAIKGYTKYSFRTNHEKFQDSAVSILQSNHENQGVNIEGIRALYKRPAKTIPATPLTLIDSFTLQPLPGPLGQGFIAQSETEEKNPQEFLWCLGVAVA
jgi:hypothetical protein